MNHPCSLPRVEDRVREFVAKNLVYSQDGFTYPDEASFLEEGIIDSLGILQLVEFVQKDFKLTVEQQEIVPDNFDSVHKLAEFVRRKLQSTQPQAS